MLEARGLGVQRGDRPLLRGLSFDLAPGEVVWLRGRNGRGKTTLLRLLAGLGEPVRGQVQLGGHPVRRLPEELRRRLVYLAHVNALKDDLTVVEALRFLARLRGDDPGVEAVDAALERLGVGRMRAAAVRTLSQGQRRRSALARLALPAPPAVWLLDEPFDALDDEGVRALHALLSEHAGRGGSVLLTSHQPPGLAFPVPRVLDLDAYAVAA
ncbi:MAG: cytochrome c biogenesis heme-transporting ATPase CcmA [Rubrivivax sp.]|nr:cytochrome c biogenesis heme-transporting ATPase CcmA [Rubrivivax sp.]